MVSSTSQCPNISFRKPHCPLLLCTSGLGSLEVLICCFLYFQCLETLNTSLCHSLTFFVLSPPAHSFPDSFHSQILSGPERIQVRVNTKLFLQAMGKLVVNYQLQCFKCLMQDNSLCVLRVGGLRELYYFLLS